MPEYKKSYAPSRVMVRKQEDGSTKWRLTERKVDRDGDVVEPGGGVLDPFLLNPIVLFAHGWSTQQMIPVGKVLAETVKQTKQFIDGDVVFHEGDIDPFSNMIADKVHNGFLNAGSIGFRPIVIDQEPVLPKQQGVTFKEWELMEYSIVPIPSLRSSLARREFESFAGKCADYGCELSTNLMDTVERSFDLYGAISKHVSMDLMNESMASDDSKIANEMLESFDKMNVRIEDLEKAVKATATIVPDDDEDLNEADALEIGKDLMANMATEIAMIEAELIV